MKKASLLTIAAATVLSLAFTVPAHRNRVFTVVIDAGHGGKDFGAVFESAKEKEIVASIASKISALNKESDVKIILTRSADDFVELAKRVEISNAAAPDLIVSLHLDASDDKEQSGAIFYVQPDKVENLAISFISNYIALQSAHFRSATYTTKTGDSYILKNTTAPTVLADLGYLTNRDDREFLLSDKGQAQIAENILGSINKLK